MLRLSVFLSCRSRWCGSGAAARRVGMETGCLASAGEAEDAS